ncbi:hypothetical protein MP638_001766 [Amoeboaphelidium occidentale]|nr:hypothetical protein MP638_001766 [Amoeboaphelidium occidentale]
MKMDDILRHHDNYTETELEKKYEYLKVLSRDPLGHPELFSEDLVEVILKSSIKLKESKKLLINLLLQNDQCVEYFVKHGGVLVMCRYVLSLVNQAFDASDLHMFLSLRILFIVTAKNAGSSLKLIDEGLNFINAADHFLSTSVSRQAEHYHDALNEFLKLGFNLLTHELRRRGGNYYSVNDKLGLFFQRATEVFKQDDVPIHVRYQAIHVFIHYSDISFDSFDGLLVCKILEVILSVKNTESFHGVVASLLSLIKGNTELQERFRGNILPDNMDRSLPLVSGKNDYNLLIALLTEITNENDRHVFEEFLWYLCGCDPAKVVYYCSYGSSAGLLMRKGVLNLSQIDFTTLKVDLSDIDLITGAKKGPKLPLTDPSSSLKENDEDYIKVEKALDRLAELGWKFEQ